MNSKPRQNQLWVDSDINGPSPLTLPYVIVVIAAGLPLALYGLAVTAAQNATGWLILAGLTLAAGFVGTRIPVPGRGPGAMAVTPADCFIFVAIVLLGPAPAAALACVEGFADSFWAKVRSQKKFLFNMAALTLSAYLAGTVFYSILRQPAPLDLTALNWVSFLLAAVLSAASYFLLNTLFVTAALGLSRRSRISPIWLRHVLNLAPASLLNMSVAVMMVLLFLRPFDSWAALTVVPILLFGYWSHRVSERQAEEDPAAEPVLSLRASRLIFGEEVSMRARRFVQLLVLFSLPVVLYSVAQATTQSDRNSLFLLALAALTTWFPFKISLFHGRMWITMTDVFVFAAMIQFGPEMAVMVALTEGLVFSLKNRPKFVYKWLFNVAQIAFTAFVVGYALKGLNTLVASLLIDDVQRSLAILAAALCCGFLYYLLNSSIVSVAMSFASNRSFREVWVTSVGWSGVTLSGALAGVFLIILVV